SAGWTFPSEASTTSTRKSRRSLIVASIPTGCGTKLSVLRALLARLAVRQLRSHPWQLGLAILGIALGVAVAVSIDLANTSALRAFRLYTEAVSGRATHQIVGGPSGVPEDIY